MDEKLYELLDRELKRARLKMIKAIVSLVVGLAGFILAWYWYDWRLVLILLLLLWGNNLERSAR